jgi:uncharacterized protein YqgC (DUF456 family)
VEGVVAAALWIVVIALMALGVVGTVVPVVPGAVLILLGAVLGAWIDDWARVSWWTLGTLGMLTIISVVVDFVSGSFGAKRLGASRLAMTGAAVGTLAGMFTGLWGLLFMPFVGAAIGEYISLRNLERAGRVGIATGVGLLIGTAVKIALAFSMIGIFIAALLL